MTSWGSDIINWWNKLRSEPQLSNPEGAGFTWSGWKVVSLFGSGKRHSVLDGNGNTVMETEYENLARLVAAFPEIFEADLRPGYPLTVCGEDGRRRQIPQMQDVGELPRQHVYDLGYQHGWVGGAAEMEAARDAQDAADEKEQWDLGYKAGRAEYESK